MKVLALLLAGFLASVASTQGETPAAPPPSGLRNAKVTTRAVSPGALPRRFLSSRTMISSKAPAAIAPYWRWSSSRRSPGIPITPIARPFRACGAVAPIRPALVWGSTIIRCTKSAIWRMPSTLWQ